MTVTLTDAHRRALLATARLTLEAALRGEREAPAPAEPVVDRHAPAFVTLFARGVLRGCTGALHDNLPLSRLVARLAVSTAFSDPRFPAVRSSEMALIRFEISVLTLPSAATPDDVEVGRHGVIIERPPHRGLLLPQVALEHNFGRAAFLAAACRKAGLPPDAYREPRTALFVFEADVFGES